MSTLVFQMMMEQGQKTVATGEVSTVYLVTIKIAAPEDSLASFLFLLFLDVAETIFQSIPILFTQMLCPLRTMRMTSRQRKLRSLVTMKMIWKVSLWMRMNLMGMAKL